jgi:hypothetical protein
MVMPTSEFSDYLLNEILDSNHNGVIVVGFLTHF